MENVGDLAFATALLTGMVVGATELVNAIAAGDKRRAAKIAVAALIGGLGGWLLLPVIGLALGIVTGLTAAGIVTGVQKVGTATPAQPTSLKG